MRAWYMPTSCSVVMSLVCRAFSRSVIVASTSCSRADPTPSGLAPTRNVNEETNRAINETIRGSLFILSLQCEEAKTRRGGPDDPATPPAESSFCITEGKPRRLSAGVGFHAKLGPMTDPVPPDYWRDHGVKI